MLYLVPLAFFCLVAVQAGRAIRREAAALDRFRELRALAGLAWLFPFGPALLEFGGRLLPFPLAPSLALACYLPAIAVARKLIRAFDAAGDETLAGARLATERVFGVAVAGVLYALVTLGMMIAARPAHVA
jgi:hypothetical protein